MQKNLEVLIRKRIDTETISNSTSEESGDEFELTLKQRHHLALNNSSEILLHNKLQSYYSDNPLVHHSDNPKNLNKNCISYHIILKGLESNPIYEPSDE